MKGIALNETSVINALGGSKELRAVNQVEMLAIKEARYITCFPYGVAFVESRL